MNNDGVSSDLINTIDEDHLHVYLRIKDCDDNHEALYEISDDLQQTIISKVPEGSIVIRNIKEDSMMKKYKFSQIFGPKTTQVTIFNELVKPKLLQFINGNNTTLLTYGASSSGKTHTIVGNTMDPGVIPRSLDYLFANISVLEKIPTVKPTPLGKVSKLTEKQLEKEMHLKEEILTFSLSNSSSDHFNNYWKMSTCSNPDTLAEIKKNCKQGDFSVWISFAEIYNEHIYDLLQSGTSKKEKLKLGCANGETYVKNLNLVHVTSKLEAYQVLQYGLHRLNYAKTKINDHSSRSHSIFTLWLTQGVHDGEECRISHFNFCDLAGAERSKKTLNVGDRLKESNNINTSLMVLGRCIAAVRKAQHSSDSQIIPFRESKLTRLFQKALSGNEDTCMIVNINPCREHFEETQHVLNFSALAKDIVVEHPPSTPSRNERIAQFLSDILRTSKSGVPLGQNEKNAIAEVVCELDLEELDRTTGSEVMRNDIISEYTRNYEEHNDEIKYKLLCLKRKMREQCGKQIQMHKSEKSCGYCHNTPDVSDNESDASECSAIISLCSDEDSDTNTTLSFDEEEGDINIWRRKVKQQDSLIAEHHKTISRLMEQLEIIRAAYDEEIRQLRIEKDSRIHQLLMKMRDLEEKSFFS